MKKMRKMISRIVTGALVTCTLLGGAGTNRVSAAAALHWPVPGHTNLSQGFHDGNAIDISDGSIGGARVVAAIGGQVSAIYLCPQQHYGSYGDCNGFGTGIVIRGEDGRYYQYAHMQANSVPSDVYYGAWVAAGQTLGAVGTTGNSTGNHLHFAIAIGNYWNQSGINPNNENYVDRYSQPAAVSLSYSDVKTTFVDTKNACLYGQISNPQRAAVPNIGAYVWDSAGKLVINHSEYCGLKTSVVYQTLDIVKEALPGGLKSGETYTYQLWAQAGGKTFYSGKGSFTMQGTKQPAVTVKQNQTIQIPSSTVFTTYGSSGTTLRAEAPGALSFKSSDTSIASVDSSGRVKPQNCGKTTVRISAAATSAYNSASKDVTIYVTPKQTAIKKAGSTKKKTLSVSWKMQNEGSGYLVQYSKNSNFSTAKTVQVKSKWITSLKITGLASKQTYYVRVRSYKSSGDLLICGNYSAVRPIAVK